VNLNPFSSRAEPPPVEPGGELERVPRASSTATATSQLHLRLTTESKAAGNLRATLERDGKRVSGAMDHGRLMTSFCVDVASLDLQRFTGTVHVCSSSAFEAL
jgi:hypothetical protein